MLLNVVVSAFSLARIGDLKDLLDGLSKQTYKDIEVIVVIDESKELYNRIMDYIYLKKYSNVSLVFNPTNRGLSYSRNLGIEKSSSEIIAFIDDDAIPYPYWAKSIIETFAEDDNIGAVTGDIVPLFENENMSWFPKELYWMISCSYVMTPTIKQEVERGFGTNMIFKKIVFDKMGVFDINFGINGKKWVGGEDTDMFLRAKKMGMKVLFNPSVRVQHKIYRHRIHLKNIIKRAYNGGYSVALMKKRTKYMLSESTESSYFFLLAKDFYPRSIKQIFSSSPSIHIKQLFVVTIVVAFETIGYLIGYLGL